MPPSLHNMESRDMRGSRAVPASPGEGATRRQHRGEEEQTEGMGREQREDTVGRGPPCSSREGRVKEGLQRAWSHSLHPLWLWELKRWV